MRIFESINKGFESKYGDLDGKKEKKVTECDKVTVKKESCNKKVVEGVTTKLSTRAEARKKFENGEEIYAGLKDGGSLFGFKKDDETPTFYDVIRYITDDYKVKDRDIQWAISSDSVKESCNNRVAGCTDTRFRGKKEIKEYKDMGQDLSEYQKWVDYDMKRYHKISDKTMGEIKKAGLSVVKDQYGDYEVIAKEPVRESLKLIMDIGDYRPWSGAVDTFYKIQDADMVGALEAYLEDIYPEGLTVTELNDILWFDGESVLRDLGIADEEDDEDEDEEDIDESCKKSVKEGKSIDIKKLRGQKK